MMKSDATTASPDPLSAGLKGTRKAADHIPVCAAALPLSPSWCSPRVAVPASQRRSVSRSERRDHRATSEPRAAKCADCERDAKGRIKRSAAATHEFRRANPCPATGRTTGACPGCQIGRRVPPQQGRRRRPRQYAVALRPATQGEAPAAMTARITCPARPRLLSTGSCPSAGRPHGASLRRSSPSK